DAISEMLKKHLSKKSENRSGRQRQQKQPTWKHDEIFPIIAHVIERQYRGDQRYVPAREIGAELLRDPEAMAIITRAQSQQGEHSLAEHIAATMVAWFSQQITVDNSPWKHRFERTKIDGRWAYRPVSPTTNPTELVDGARSSPVQYEGQ